MVSTVRMLALVLTVVALAGPARANEEPDVIFGAGRSARMFVDGELGVTTALLNDNTLGVSIMPCMFAGVRVGYDIYSNRDSSPSRTFEHAFLIRATAVREGAGIMFGVGMYWATDAENETAGTTPGSAPIRQSLRAHHIVE